MKITPLLGNALIHWRLARTPEADYCPNEDELRLAHSIAWELCELSLNEIRGDASEPTKDTWRDVFVVSVPTLAVFGTPDSCSLLMALEQRTSGLHESHLLFRVLVALLSFQPERVRAMERILDMELPHDLMKTRDYLLEAVLESPSTLPVSDAERRHIARTAQNKIRRYSTKTMGKVLSRLIDDLLN